MLCGVDLFPVPDKILDENIAVPRSTMSSDLPNFVVYTPSQGSSSSASPPGMGNVSPRASRVSSDHASAPFEMPTSGNLRLNYPGSSQSTESAFTYFPRHPFTTPSAEGDGAPRDNPFQIPRRQPMLGHLNEAEPPSDVILRIGNHLVTESSKLTPALVGEKFVEPVLVDYKGKKCFFFVFGVRFLFIYSGVSMELKIALVRIWPFKEKEHLYFATGLSIYTRAFPAVKDIRCLRNYTGVPFESTPRGNFLV